MHTPGGLLNKGRNLFATFIAGFVIFSFSSCRPTVYYIVRHAEKTGNNLNDPLTPTGFSRAAVLRDSLLNKGIDSVFATEYLRTQQTVQPLASAINRSVSVIDHNQMPQLLNILRSLKRRQVLVAGHTTTVPQIVRQLSGKVIDPIRESDYDNMYIIKISGKDTTLTRITYGAITN